LQPFNLHFHEGHELQGPGDVDPTNATNTAAESFLQSADQDFTSDDDSFDFPLLAWIPALIFPLLALIPVLIHLALNLLLVLLQIDPPQAGAMQRGSPTPACLFHLCRVWVGVSLLAGPLMQGCRPHPLLR
jgi:hypothetical protein